MARITLGSYLECRNAIVTATTQLDDICRPSVSKCASPGCVLTYENMLFDYEERSHSAKYQAVDQKHGGLEIGGNFTTAWRSFPVLVPLATSGGRTTNNLAALLVPSRLSLRATHRARTYVCVISIEMHIMPNRGRYRISIIRTIRTIHFQRLSFSKSKAIAMTYDFSSARKLTIDWCFFFFFFFIFYLVSSNIAHRHLARILFPSSTEGVLLIFSFSFSATSSKSSKPVGSV